jgi:dihydrofolate synthase/folylpolyglutamate synthase
MLASLATTICPELSQCQTFADVCVALNTVIQNKSNSDRLIVLCGSLYLVGYFLYNL